MKLLGILLPLGMLVAIVATGNHFVLDAIGGVLVIGLAYGLVLLFTRLRERVNGNRPQTGASSSPLTQSPSGLAMMTSI